MLFWQNQSNLEKGWTKKRIWQCLTMFDNVLQCFTMFYNVWQCMAVYIHDVDEPECSKVYHMYHIYDNEWLV